MVRRVLFNLHLIVAFVAAVFVVILGITGSIMAFEGEIDRALNPRLWRVIPRGSPKPLAEIGDAAVISVYVSRPVLGYSFGVTADQSYVVSLPGTSVFINQYTGQVLGSRSGPTWLSQIHQLHLRLLAGDTGKTIVSWAGVLIVFLVLSGIYLWWPVKRIGVNWAAGGRRRWFDLHNATGVLAFVFLFLLSITGGVIGFERTTTPFFSRITGSQPLPGNFPVTPPPGVRALTPDRAIAIARQALPGAVPIGVNVAGPKTPYRIALRYPEDLTPGGRSRVFVDPYTGVVLQAESSRTAAAGTRLVTLNRAIHTGDLFGVPGKILMSLASLAAVLQVISGLTMWWKRPAAKRS